MRKAVILVAVALLPVAGGATTPRHAPELRADEAARLNSPLRRAMLDLQNDARRDVGVPPLVWDDKLAADAMAYAKEMARTHRFQHAQQPFGPGREGENLLMSARDANSYDTMVRAWLDEKRYFVNRPALDFSTTGNWIVVGHYTQIVWRTTTRVGCALASSTSDDYLVCRYLPPGNVIGLKAL